MQNVRDVGDEIPHQKNRHQYRPDQCQQRRSFECHGRSMNAASSGAQMWLLRGGCSTVFLRFEAISTPDGVAFRVPQKKGIVTTHHFTGKNEFGFALLNS